MMTTEKRREVAENIKEEMKDVLSDRDYEYSDYAINRIVDTFFEQKAALIDVLSHHPMWDDDKLMIQFDADIERNICVDEVHNFANFLYDSINRNEGFTTGYYYVISNFICRIRTQFFEEDKEVLDKIDYVNTLNDNYKLRPNMKSSKAIGKICREEGWDKFDGYNKRYAALCDCLNPLKITRHTCISVNPIDFLLMSNGDTWHSCHDIDYQGSDPGCYSSGTISYMLDQHSFLFYTVDASYNGNHIERAKKSQREVFGYNDEVLAQLRLYPQSNDYGAEQVYSDIRAIVQKIIADCLGKPNYWILSKNDTEEVISHGYDATCYPDWRHGNPGSDFCSISTLKGREKGKEDREIVFGAQPICIECGERHYETENISCCHDGYEYCQNCGERICEDDVVWIDGEPYCGHCVTYCDYCGEYHLNDNVTYIDGYNVCDDCIEKSGDYGYCDDCGDIHHIDYLYFTEGGTVYCNDCAPKHICTCAKCNSLLDIDYSLWDEETDNEYCDWCYRKLIDEREAEKEIEEDYEEETDNNETEDKLDDVLRMVG